MKKFILGLIVAISLPVFAAVIWPSGDYLKTINAIKGIEFGTGKILSVLNDVITFDGKRIDQKSPNVFYQEDFKGADVSFTCGSNFNKAQSGGRATFTQGATPPMVGVVCESPLVEVDTVKDVDPRGNDTGLCFAYQYDGDDDDLAIVVYDDTGDDKGTLLVKNSSSDEEDCIYFTTPTAATDLYYSIEVLVQNANAVLDVGYFSFKTNPLDVKNVSNTQKISISEAGSAMASRIGEFQFSSVNLGSGGAISIEQDNANNRTKFIANRNTSLSITISFIATSGNRRIAVAINDTIKHYTVTEQGSGDGYGGSFLVDLEAGDFVTFGLAANSMPPSFDVSQGVVNTADEIEVTMNAVSSTQGVIVKGEVASDVQNENVFSVNIENNGSASPKTNERSPDVQWWDSITRDSSGTVTVSYTSLGLAIVPSYQAIALEDGGNSRTPEVVSVSNTEITIVTKSPGGAESDADFSLEIRRQGTDYVRKSDIDVVFPNGIAPKTCYVKDVKSDGVEGGGAIAGTQTRTLNTLTGDCDFLTLSSSIMTIQKGSYGVDCTAPAYQVGETQAFFTRDSDGENIILGDSPYIGGSVGASVKSRVMDRVDILATGDYKLNHYTQSAKSTDGLGRASAGSADEVYTQCVITKLR